MFFLEFFEVTLESFFFGCLHEIFLIKSIQSRKLLHRSFILWNDIEHSALAWLLKNEFGSLLGLEGLYSGVVAIVAQVFLDNVIELVEVHSFK